MGGEKRARVPAHEAPRRIRSYPSPGEKYEPRIAIRTASAQTADAMAMIRVIVPALDRRDAVDRCRISPAHRQLAAAARRIHGGRP